MKLIFELPFYSPSVGGIIETIKFAQKMDAHIRFQRKSDYPIPFILNHSVGMPDNTFPKCDVCVTYSDNPFLNRLVELPQVGRVMVYMMSWGMSYANERHNALHPEVTTLCTTKKIEDAIVAEGGKVHRIGFALDMADMEDFGETRSDTLALYYHPMESKRYKLAVDISNGLYGQNFIDNVVSFGTKEGYQNFKKPAGLVKHYPNANRGIITGLFNASKLFVNPSVSEGLNLTPIEATLCGCPSVIVDGAIGELFIDGVTCFVAKKDDYFEILNDAIEMLSDIDIYRVQFADNLREIVAEYTWENLIKKFKEVL